MTYDFGKNIKLSVYGGSHEPSVGFSLDGLPARSVISLERLQAFLDRRAPGRNAYTSSRKEADCPVFVKGLHDNTLTGETLIAQLPNSDVRSQDYHFQDIPRPSHADYTGFLKYGDSVSLSGGGPFSGRMTAPLCVAGGIALQLLEKQGICIGAHLLQIGNLLDTPFPLMPEDELLSSLSEKSFPVLDDAVGEEMKQQLESLRQQGDSIGANVECVALHVPAGIGGPLFDGLESKLSAALFAIPGVKAISFGSGTKAASMLGSQHNDPFVWDGSQVKTKTNYSGGIQGGISNGMPLLLQVTFKPTASIGIPQQTLRLSDKQEVSLTIEGRHDPCIAVRGVPVVEAVTALVLLDELLGEKHDTQ